MAIKITDELVEYLARLSMIKLSPEQFKKLKSDLQEILDHIENLNKINTENVKPTIHLNPYKNLTRDDIPEKGLSVEYVRLIAPLIEKDYFVVPPVIEIEDTESII